MKIKELIEDFNPIYIEDLNIKDHPFIFIANEKYQILIIRNLSFKDKKLDHESLAYIFFDGQIYSYCKDKQELQILKGNFNELYQKITPIYEQNKMIIEGYANEIDILEDKIYERNLPRHFMDAWFDIKKDMHLIERYYQRSNDCINDMIKHYVKNDNFPQSEFKDIHESIGQHSSKVIGQIARLDGIYRYYESVKNDRLNRNIYLLTFISAIFLPLNLIVGFFGINTGGLFFKENPLGTYYVLWILFGMLAFSIAGLKIFRVIDQYILKRVLNNYDVYKSISKTLDELLKVD